MDCTINAQKNFPASVEHIYEAWTEEEHLKKWWQPGRFILAGSGTEVKTGGKIEYRFEDTEAKTITLTGSYLEVVPNKLLDFEWQWQEAGNNPGTKQHIRIEFRAEAQGSSVHICQENEDSDSSKEEGHQYSWEEALEHLVVYVADRFAVS